MAWRARLFSITPQIRFLFSTEAQSSAGVRDFLENNISELQFLNPTTAFLVRPVDDVKPHMHIAIHPNPDPTPNEPFDVFEDLDPINPNFFEGKALSKLLSGPSFGLFIPLENKSQKDIEAQFATIHKAWVLKYGHETPNQSRDVYVTSSFETEIPRAPWVSEMLKGMEKEKLINEAWEKTKKELADSNKSLE